jgi:hypothetical protein
MMIINPLSAETDQRNFVDAGKTKNNEFAFSVSCHASALQFFRRLKYEV